MRVRVRVSAVLWSGMEAVKDLKIVVLWDIKHGFIERFQAPCLFVRSIRSASLGNAAWLCITAEPRSFSSLLARSYFMMMSHQSNYESSLRPRLCRESHASAGVTGGFYAWSQHSTSCQKKPLVFSLSSVLSAFFCPTQPASFSFVRKAVAICICTIFCAVILRGRNSFNESIYAQHKALRFLVFLL